MKRKMRSDNTLLLLAKIAKLAQLGYGGREAFVAEELEMQTYTLDFVARKGTELVMLGYEDTLYISFRGTEMHYTDIIPHAVRSSVLIAGARVHKGYWQKLGAVLPSITSAVRKIGDRADVIFVGHSLGGALAQLAYQHCLHQHPIHRLQCYTFGSCKPIKKLTTPLNMHHEAHNFYLKKDYVGLFPYGYSVLGTPLNMHHEAHNFYLKKDYVGLFPYGYSVLGTPIILDDETEYKKDTLPLWGLIKSISSIFVTKRHAIDNYIEEIRKK